MRDDTVVPVVLAIAGYAAIVVGIHQGVLHVAPGYQGTINAGGEVLGRREWLLTGTGVIGIGGAAVSLRRKRLSIVPAAVGGAVLFEACRTMIIAARSLPYPLYTETTYRFSGEPIMFVFGAEPFLLVAGGGLLVGAGIVGLRGRRNRESGDETSSPSSRAA
ncbi:hypothetical protein [Halorarum salinum]|uniref:Uncharacterized protein n=1 Tax=Halorarum salinum TaxID=2743089 RepID=A0A7D5QA32_9EURY|nr:hypothetical protein [Halobaculum salinum]QLG62117.1 hypothetical protein HUG12_10395 [Halobaculum salinum]